MQHGPRVCIYNYIELFYIIMYTYTGPMLHDYVASFPTQQLTVLC